MRVVLKVEKFYSIRKSRDGTITIDNVIDGGVTINGVPIVSNEGVVLLTGEIPVFDYDTVIFGVE